MDIPSLNELFKVAYFLAAITGVGFWGICGWLFVKAVRAERRKHTSNSTLFDWFRGSTN